LSIPQIPLQGNFKHYHFLFMIFAQMMKKDPCEAEQVQPFAYFLGTIFSLLESF
jgi:hypothetical protein